MQGKRHESEPRCGCGPADPSCAALTVRQLSQDRVRELAEEIWARSTGGRLPASLDHLVIGPTGVWVVRSWRPSWPAALRKGGAAGMVRGLRGEARAVADALADAGDLPVHTLLCAHGWPWPAAGRPVHEVRVATPRRLAAVVRSGPRVRRGEADRTADRALKVLRPAA
jgi:hypothetical protein